MALITVTYDDDNDIIINKDEYISLLDDGNLLNCLRNAGVDNWDGWEYALEEYHNGDEE